MAGLIASLAVCGAHAEGGVLGLLLAKPISKTAMQMLRERALNSLAVTNSTKISRSKDTLSILAMPMVPMKATMKSRPVVLVPPQWVLSR